MVNRYELSKSDSAFLSYVNMHLKGKTARMNKQLNRLLEHEILELNEPIYEEDSSEEKVNRVTNQSQLLIDEEVSYKVAVELAMKSLTEKEVVIITELFWNQKKVSELTQEMNVSKNAILKMRRNDLKKMRQTLGIVV
jgi:DNA-directed RNA polymerase specialized sigma subunit